MSNFDTVAIGGRIPAGDVTRRLGATLNGLPSVWVGNDQREGLASMFNNASRINKVENMLSQIGDTHYNLVAQTADGQPYKGPLNLGGRSYFPNSDGAHKIRNEANLRFVKEQEELVRNQVDAIVAEILDCSSNHTAMQILCMNPEEYDYAFKSGSCLSKEQLGGHEMPPHLVAVDARVESFQYAGRKTSRLAVMKIQFTVRYGNCIPISDESSLNARALMHQQADHAREFQTSMTPNAIHGGGGAAPATGAAFDPTV